MVAGGNDHERWRDYVFCRGPAFHTFWSEHLSEASRDVLVIVGCGFDPRMCLGIEAILSAEGSGRRDVLLIRFNSDQQVSGPEQARIDGNEARIREAVEGGDNIFEVEVPMRIAGGESLASQNTFEALSSPPVSYDDYHDIVLDVSAIPRTIALTALAKLLWEVDNNLSSDHNLHVIVAENLEINTRITQRDLDEETITLTGFSGEVTAESTSSTPRVWLPILGENREPHLERIRNEIMPDEICPVIPWPSSQPRRGDELIKEYRSLLFDSFQVEPRNILYASEFNPFGVYRQLSRAIKHYDEALEDVGGCKALVSPLSSKLLSVGALLACYELKELGYTVGIPYLEARTYTISDDLGTTEETILHEIWVAGECYET